MRAKNCLGPMLTIVALLAAVPVVASTLRVHIDEQNSVGLADAVVVLTPAGNKTPGNFRRKTVAVMDQVDKKFDPFVLVVQAGTQIRFPNHDNTRHHVYSFSPAKRFELPLYAEYSAPPVPFDEPGVVILGCNIHDWMVGYIYVAESPYFGKTDESGNAVIADIPAGSYAARVWHPSMVERESDTSRAVVVGDDVGVVLRVQIKVTTPPPQRRAPMPRSRLY